MFRVCVIPAATSFPIFAAPYWIEFRSPIITDIGLARLNLPDVRVNALVDALRHGGFDVVVHERAIELTPEQCAEFGIAIPETPLVSTELYCKRDEEEFTLGILPDDETPPNYHIYIPQKWAWRPARRRKLAAIHDEVMVILKNQGAYFP